MNNSVAYKPILYKYVVHVMPGVLLIPYATMKLVWIIIL